MQRHNQTRAKIVKTALDLYVIYGIKKTTVEDVSDKCGITRATVYRYFSDKEDLVRASFMYMVEVIQETLAELDAHKNYDTKKSTDRVKYAINRLPQGDIPGCVNELKLLYPDIFTEYRDARLASITGIYKIVFDTARKDGLINSSDNTWELMPSILAEATLYITESPLVLSHGIPFREIYANLIDLMLYGVMSRKKRHALPPRAQQ
jgi:AcrR family transcriptional regulator